MTPQEFLTRFSKEVVPRVVAFIGEERFWYDEGLKLIEEKLFRGEDADFGRIMRSAHGLNPNEILAELAAPPFFGPSRMVVVTEIEKIHTSLEEALLKGLNRLAEGTWFILQGEKIDRRRALAKRLQDVGTIVDCVALKPQQAQDWVIQEARRQGLTIESSIARMLVERRGTHPGMLREELRKASLFSDGGKVSREQWEDLIGASSETNIFGLLDSVALGRTLQALNYLNQLSRMGEPEMRILYMVGKQIRQLLWAVIVREHGGNVGILQKELGCHPFVAEKTWEQASQFDLTRLAKAVERVLKAETNIKTGRGDQRWELEMAVVDLTLG